MPPDLEDSFYTTKIKKHYIEETDKKRPNGRMAQLSMNLLCYSLSGHKRMLNIGGWVIILLLVGSFLSWIILFSEDGDSGLVPMPGPGQGDKTIVDDEQYTFCHIMCRSF